MAIKMIIKNLFEMPVWMRFLPFLGLAAPLLVVFTVIDKEVAVNSHFSFEESITFLLIIVSALPIFFASILMLRKSKLSRYIYILGWLAICFSPILMPSERVAIDVFLMDLSFNLLIGVTLVIYLFRNKQVQNYYLSK